MLPFRIGQIVKQGNCKCFLIFFLSLLHFKIHLPRLSRNYNEMIRHITITIFDVLAVSTSSLIKEKSLRVLTKVTTIYQGKCSLDVDTTILQSTLFRHTFVTYIYKMCPIIISFYVASHHLFHS